MIQLSKIKVVYYLPVLHGNVRLQDDLDWEPQGGLVISPAVGAH